jgi:SAM-dependent methyltransferase
MSNSSNYHDYVIKDGYFIGDFEGLYKNFSDPWDQLEQHKNNGEKKKLILALCNHLKNKFGFKSIVDIGCGLGHLTNDLSNAGFNATGIDISLTAIEKAKNTYSSVNFEVGTLLDFEKFSSEIILMSDVTWYSLDNLDCFVKKLKARKEPTALVHLLTTYPVGEQKYGVDKFTNLEEILKYYNLKYIDQGVLKESVNINANFGLTYFSAVNFGYP